MIERRSHLAFESYAQSIKLGATAESAVRAADKVLFRGLLFSKYDTVHLILATDFPIIPENQRQEIALRLVRICAPKDDFSERPEFRQLKEELRTGIRNWIDENGVPGYHSPARKEKPPVSYSEQSRHSKRNKRK